VVGTPAIDLPSVSMTELRRIGAMIRSIHDVCAEIGPEFGEAWDLDVRIPAEQPDLLCHNDLGAWNLITGERWVFIDWDAFGPSTRLWDLAYAAQSIANLNAGEPVREAAERLGALVDGYGADRATRAALPGVLSLRTRGMYEMLATANRDGRQPWGRMFEEEHGGHWLRATQYVAEHQDTWQEVLNG
jgi:Ser/Thr protein kinase RdoA (MazF antagonist)